MAATQERGGAKWFLNPRMREPSLARGFPVRLVASPWSLLVFAHICPK